MKSASIASRVFNRPHLLEPQYGRVLIGALSERLSVESLRAPDGVTLDAADLRQAAAGFERKPGSIVDQVEGIAVIPVTGTLVHRFGHIDPYSGMTGYDGIQAKVEHAIEDPSIRGVLLDINSPGGEVSGCFDLADFIASVRDEKPVWAIADELCCSAAYAIASAAERTILPRTGQAGSIDVLTAHVDHSKRLERSGLDVTLIFAGEHKVDANPFEPLPEGARKDLQVEVDELYGEFVRTVARNRGMSVSAVKATKARVFTGRKAVDAGLADDVKPASDVLAAFDARLESERSPATRAAGPPTIQDITASHWNHKPGVDRSTNGRVVIHGDARDFAAPVEHGEG